MQYLCTERSDGTLRRAFANHSRACPTVRVYSRLSANAVILTPPASPVAVVSALGIVECAVDVGADGAVSDRWKFVAVACGVAINGVGGAATTVSMSGVTVLAECNGGIASGAMSALAATLASPTGSSGKSMQRSLASHDSARVVIPRAVECCE